MIKAYKINYHSPHTEIKSYTLFGAFCWGYRFLNGKEKLEEFLEEFYKKPKFLISSPFPLINKEPIFPKPQLRLENEENLSIIDKLKRKPYKKASFISKSVLEDIIKGAVKTQNDLMKKYNVKGSVIVKNNEETGKIKNEKLIVAHNQINRLNNISENLYFENGEISVQDNYFLVKFFDESFINDFENILKIIEDNGLGGNKNIGWGKVKISNLEKDFSFLEKSKSDFFITLSPLIPSNNMLTDKSYYTFSTFKSFTEGTFNKSRTKNKVIYLEEGSLVYRNGDFAGTIKKMENIYQYGLEFPVYLE